jgi:hypothetical protein
MATGVRANWHLDALAVDDDDPFADSPRPSVKEVGKPIDLSQETAKLHVSLQALLRREERLYGMGIRCALKQDRDNTCCSACPVAKDHDPDDRLGDLCSTGKEQERVLMRLATAEITAPSAPA